MFPNIGAKPNQNDQHLRRVCGGGGSSPKFVNAAEERSWTVLYLFMSYSREPALSKFDN